MNEWKQFRNFPYECCVDGTVRHSKTLRIKHPSRIKAGYLLISLWLNGQESRFYVHRMVCEVFHGLPIPEMNQVAHFDGNKLNNHADNLRWATRAQNELDKVRHGRSNRGERNGMAKLKDSEAMELRADALRLPRSSGGKRMKKGAVDILIEKYGLSRAGVRLIISKARRH